MLHLGEGHWCRMPGRTIYGDLSGDHHSIQGTVEEHACPIDVLLQQCVVVVDDGDDYDDDDVEDT